MPDLRAQLRNYYRHRRLPESRLQELPGIGAQPARSVRRAVAAAGVLCAFLGGLGLGVALVREAPPTIVAEVTAHHAEASTRTAALDGRFDTAAGLASALPHLGFDVPASALSAVADRLKGYTLLGGNYCEIRGLTAVQLIYRRPEDGTRATAYLQPWSGAAIERLHASQDAARVRAWTHNGRFYAVVRNDAENR